LCKDPIPTLRSEAAPSALNSTTNGRTLGHRFVHPASASRCKLATGAKYTQIAPMTPLHWRSTGGCRCISPPFPSSPPPSLPLPSLEACETATDWVGGEKLVKGALLVVLSVHETSLVLGLFGRGKQLGFFIITFGS